MKRIRVLIADGSALTRDLIRAIIEIDPEMEVAGEAASAGEAVEKAGSLRPDIMTMDVEMPHMDGLQAIEKIMAGNAMPIVVVTARDDARTSFEALSRGALDLVIKQDLNLESARSFISKLKLMSKVRVVSHISGRCSRPLRADTAETAPDEHAELRIIAIAASTGGPAALSLILHSLPPAFPLPIVIAQHIADGFAGGMAVWLGKKAQVRIRVAADGDCLRPGSAYVCPSEYHMQVKRSGKIVFLPRRPEDIYRPSCDVLLSSVAEAFGEKAIGVILTGMGHDGVKGIARIKDAGGMTIAQDEKSSIIFGMPKLAIENGSIDRVLPVDAIGGELIRAAYHAATPAVWTGQCH